MIWQIFTLVLGICLVVLSIVYLAVIFRYKNQLDILESLCHSKDVKIMALQTKQSELLKEHAEKLDKHAESLDAAINRNRELNTKLSEVLDEKAALETKNAQLSAALASVFKEPEENNKEETTDGTEEG